jgi:hypothetical protein
VTFLRIETSSVNPFRDTDERYEQEERAAG